MPGSLISFDDNAGKSGCNVLARQLCRGECSTLKISQLERLFAARPDDRVVLDQKNPESFMHY